MSGEQEHDLVTFVARRSMRVILIVGMHRSGTSCLAGSLQQRGLHLGDVQERNPHNLKGNRESRRIMHLNDAVLTHAGGSWKQLPAAVTWTREHAAERDAVISTLSAESATGCWGFKDPRTLATLPFWYDGIASSVTAVGSFRHPAQVARSLHARGKMPYEEGCELWRSYNERLLREFRRKPFPLVCFDLAEPDYLEALDRVAEALALTQTAPGGEHVFFERGLRHEQVDGSLPEVPADCIDLYQLLLEAGRSVT